MYHRTRSVPGMCQNVMEGVFFQLMTETKQGIQVSAVWRCGTGSVDRNVLRDAVPSSSAAKHSKENSPWSFSWCKNVYLACFTYVRCFRCNLIKCSLYEGEIACESLYRIVNVCRCQCSGLGICQATERRLDSRYCKKAFGSGRILLCLFV